jgi:predicted CoA-binding protein
MDASLRERLARIYAEAAGLTVVMNRCMGVTHRELGLGHGPD